VKSRGEKDCRICNGSRHRWDKKRKQYIACVCLRAKRQVGSYRAAGIPQRYDDETWRSWEQTYKTTGVRKLLEAAKTLAQGDQPDQWVLVHGRPMMAHSVASALLLRAACDGGLSAKALDLPYLIDAELQHHNAGQYYALDVVAVKIGDEAGNKWNRIVLERLLHYRWEQSLFTLLLVAGDPSRVAASYKSPRIVTAISRFHRVTMFPKDGE